MALGIAEGEGRPRATSGRPYTQKGRLAHKFFQTCRDRRPATFALGKLAPRQRRGIRQVRKKEVDLSTSFLFDLSPDQVVERNVIVIGKLDRRPQGQLALSSLISLVNGKLHIKRFGNLLLCFITMLRCPILFSKGLEESVGGAFLKASLTNPMSFSFRQRCLLIKAPPSRLLFIVAAK